MKRRRVPLAAWREWLETNRRQTADLWSKAMAAKTEAPSGRLKPHHSVAWAAIARHADKEAERSTLPAGSHSVELEVGGRAGGRAFHASIAGTLTVTPDGTRDLVEKAPAENVIAWLLQEFCRDAHHRAQVLNELPNVWQEEFPALDQAGVEQAKEMLARLRARTGTVSQYGAVKFTPGPAS
jgi:hypothetical protein